MLRSRPIAEHFAAFPADPGALDDLRRFVHSALAETTLANKAVAGLMLAVEEAASNIIRHGYLFGPGRLEIRVRRTRSAVSIVITDTGRAYTWDPNAEPDLQRMAETGRRGGLGLLLMRKVTDAVEYRREGDQNILTLVKYVDKNGSRPAGHTPQRRMLWAGVAGVAAAVLIGVFLVYRQTSRDLTNVFFARWTEFAGTTAASAAQHLLNDRSDAEFDQLIIGLKAAHPELRYLVIVDDAGRIRAHSEKPEQVHELYRSPAGVPPSSAGEWPVVLGSEKLFHFVQTMSVDRRPIGYVVLGVPDSLLAARFRDERQRAGVIALALLFLGGVLVWSGAYFLTRPLRRLGEMLQLAKSKGERIPAPVSTADDIAGVVAAIGEVNEAVARTERQMAQRDLARREMEQAEQLQRALLPQRLPDIPGYETGAAFRMAGHVGGDYYDLIPVDDDGSTWVLIVADVAGKGFPAALVMTAVRSAVRILAPLHTSPERLLAALDDFLVRHLPGGPFVTAVCGVLNARRHRLVIASAGHTPALLCSAAGMVRTINPRGRPLGLAVEDPSHPNLLECETIELHDNDMVMLYTDGLAEIYGQRQHGQGVTGLSSALAGVAGHTAGHTIDTILSGLDGFSNGSQLSDDVTLVVLRRLGKGVVPETTSLSHTDNQLAVQPR